MRAIIALALVLLLAACSDGSQTELGSSDLYYYHDAEHGVGCWRVAFNEGIDCLPDSEYRLP